MKMFIHTHRLIKKTTFAFLISTIVLTSENLLAKESISEKNKILIEKIFDLVDEEYIDSTDENDLVESAINGMLQSLDPHSIYLSPRDFNDLQNDTKGEFGGLGIEVTMENGVIKVIAPIDDTPAQIAGVLEGDYITHIDNEPILGKSLNESVNLMRGKPNSEIRITIVRKNIDEAFDLKIVRAIIKIPGVSVKTIGNKQTIGYIRISAFNEKTSEKLFQELSVPQNNDYSMIKGYILDLRRNPGGLLRQAIEVANMFLEKGEIVSTKRPRFQNTTRSFNAKPGDIIHGMPLIILVNGGSASASEIVAGALQDNHRAILIGTKTFGKGSVQTLYPIGKNNFFFKSSNNLGAVKLTTAEYFTPSGKSIQAEGIVPDIVIEQKINKDINPENFVVGETHLKKYIKNPKKEEKMSGSSSYIPENKTEDTQLNLAINLLNQLSISKDKS